MKLPHVHFPFLSATALFLMSLTLTAQQPRINRVKTACGGESVAAQHRDFFRLPTEKQCYPDGFVEKMGSLMPKDTHYHADSAIAHTLSYGDTKQLFTYDADGKILSELDQSWLNNSWTNSVFSSYSYDASGNLISLLSQEWQNNAWVNDGMGTYTYDNDGNRLSSFWQDWQNNTWVNSRQSTCTYDTFGNMLTSMDQVWQNNAWANYLLWTYTYDAGGNMLTELYQEGQGSSWVNYEQGAFSYDASGNLLTLIRQEWQYNTWVNYLSYTYTYDNQGNLLTELYLWWENNAWDNSLKTEFSYQAGEISAKAYQWTGLQWEPYEDAYFDFYYLDEYLLSANGYAAEVYYSSYTGIPENSDGDQSALILYPNPATDQVTMTFNRSVTGACAISLLDLSGRLVKVLFEGDLASSSPFAFNISDLMAGVYLLRVRSPEFSFQQKFMVVK